MKSTTVIITTYCPTQERYELCKQSFAEVHRTGLDRDQYDLIVINNGGIHEDLIDTLDADVVITNSKNLGVAAGVNMGIAIAQSYNIAMMNDDLSYREGWLHYGCKLVKRYPEFVISVMGLRGKQHKYIIGREDGHWFTRKIAGNAWIFRRKIYDQIGRFGMGYFSPGGYYTRNLLRKGYGFVIGKRTYITDLGGGKSIIGNRRSRIPNWRRESKKMPEIEDETYAANYIYWTQMKGAASFNRGLLKVARDYYLDIVDRYKTKSILDVGCGFGDTYGLLAHNKVNIQYAGLDAAPNFIGICQKRYPDAEFEVGLIQQIPHADNSFDMVTCRAVLEHVPNPDPAIREMARVADKVVVIVWFRHPGTIEQYVYKKRGYWENDYSRERILDIASDADLNLVEEIVEDYHLVWVMEKGKSQ